MMIVYMRKSKVEEEENFQLKIQKNKNKTEKLFEKQTKAFDDE